MDTIAWDPKEININNNNIKRKRRSSSSNGLQQLKNKGEQQQYLINQFRPLVNKREEENLEIEK